MKTKSKLIIRISVMTVILVMISDYHTKISAIENIPNNNSTYVIISESQKDSTEIPSEIVSESTVGMVIFPHLEHYEDLGIECIECHHEIGAKSINIPHKNFLEDYWVDCEICHKSRNSDSKPIAHGCSNCHHSNPVNIADEMVSKKVAIHKNCWTCHEIGTGVEARENCFLCHTE